MYSYILFDLDGTLTDPGLGITNSVAYALEQYRIRVPERQALYKFIGPPLKDSFMEYYGFSDEESMRAIEQYRVYFRSKGIFENVVYDGVPEMLQALKDQGKTVILATSKPEEFARTILKHFELDHWFDVVAGATMDEKLSRKDEIITLALQRAGVTDLSKAVMVGDRKHDIEGAHVNGLDSIGVLYGYGDLEELTAAGATYLAEDPGKILNLV